MAHKTNSYQTLHGSESKDESMRDELNLLVDKCNAVILLDNSNLWIEGKKASAKVQSLLHEQNSSWRIGYVELLELILQEVERVYLQDNKITDEPLSKASQAALKATTMEKLRENIACLRLFASIPSGDEALWTAIRQYMDVDLTQRNFFNKEKQVDSKVINMAVGDATGLYQLARVGFGESVSVYKSRIYCLVSGDSDFCASIRLILALGFKVLVLSWSISLGGEYDRIRKDYPSQMRIVLLDNHIDQIGHIKFESSEPPIDALEVPKLRSFFVVLPDAHTIKSLVKEDVDYATDLEKALDSVHVAVQKVTRVSSFRRMVANPSSGMVVWMVQFDHSYKTEQVNVFQLRNAVMAARKVFIEAGFPAQMVATCNEYASGGIPTRWRRFESDHVSPGDRADDNRGSSDSLVDFSYENYLRANDQYGDDGFHVVATKASRKAKANALVAQNAPARPFLPPARIRCKHREFCFTSECVHLHSKEEQSLFDLMGRPAFKLRKTEMCQHRRCVMARCTFLHDDEKPLCRVCASAPCMGVTCGPNLTRKPISEAQFIALQARGYFE